MSALVEHPLYSHPKFHLSVLYLYLMKVMSKYTNCIPKYTELQVTKRTPTSNDVPSASDIHRKQAINAQILAQLVAISER